MTEKKGETITDSKKLNALNMAKRHLSKAQSEIDNAMDFSFGTLANAGEMLSLLARIDNKLALVAIELNRLEENKK